MRRLPVLLLALLWLGGLYRIADLQILNPGTSRASDALPLYLSAAAVDQNLDPTLQESLAKIYDERQLQVGAATFSTLYPATAGRLLLPYARLDWDDFSAAWRWTMLVAIASFPLSLFGMARGDRWTRGLWAGLLGVVLVWHPVTSECVRLGQVNMILAAFCAMAMGLTLRGPAWLGGLGLGLGGLLKLVPGALVIPLLLTRRWKPVLVTVGVGLLGLALTHPVVPLPRILTAVRETLRFQGSIDPDWLVGRQLAPDWMRWLGFLRHTPLQWITLLFSALIPALRPSKETAVGGMALICAWLGADAAGFHVLYIPLAYPALLWVCQGRPLQFSVLTGAFFLLDGLQPEGMGPESRMVLFGVILWAWSLGRLLADAGKVPSGAWEQDRSLMQGGTALAGLMVGGLLGRTWPGDGPIAAPLPEGQTIPEGPGFIHPGDRVPGQIRALGAGLDRPASTLARPGTIRALQVYLQEAPGWWRGLAERYPARATAFQARASAAPSGVLKSLSGREVANWLREEEATVQQLTAEGLDLGDLPAALEEALASGLTDPDLESRIPGENH